MPDFWENDQTVQPEPTAAPTGGSSDNWWAGDKTVSAAPNATAAPKPSQPTGFPYDDPNKTYATFLPREKDNATGKTDWAVPESIRTLVRGAMAPGDVYLGRRTDLAAAAGDTASLMGLAGEDVPLAKTTALRNPEAASRLADMEASGITPTVPTVTQSRSAGNVAKVIGEVPILGSPITDMAQKNIGEAAAQSRNIAGTYGDAGLPEEGGEALQGGRKAFQYGPEGSAKPTLEQAAATPTRNIGFVPKSEALYGAIPIEGDAPASVSNVTAKLKDLSERFPSNPDLNGLLANSTFSKMYNAIRPGTKEVPSQSPIIGTTPAGFRVGETAELAPSGQPTHVTGDTDAPVISFGDKGFQLGPSVSIRPTGANPTKLVSANAPYISSTPSGFGLGSATEIAPTGGMSWNDLRNLRSYVGQQMRQPAGQLGMGPDEWSSLYGALSSDIKDTASAAGPDALKAFNRANNYYSAGLDRLNDAMGFIDKADSPEKAYYGLTRMGSQQGKGASIDQLTAVMKSLPDEMKGDVASTVINRLGMPTKSAAGANPENFSIGTWASNYADISDKAKDALFGTAGTEQRDSLDTLSRAMTSLKNQERLGNPSGSGRLGIAATAAATTAGAFTAPISTALGAASTYGGARALMSPDIARWIANSTKTTTADGWTANLSRLGAIAQREPIAQAMYSALTQPAPQQ